MAIGIVSESEFFTELDDLNNDKKPIAEVVDKSIGGRNKGDVEVPDSLRKIIGETALEDRQDGLELAKAFGVSDSSVAAYKSGSTSCATYNGGNPALKSHMNSARERIIRKARRKLFGALDNITDDKLEQTKARDLAGIAKDMSAVIKNLEPEVKDNNSTNVNIVMYAPRMRQEIDYETITVDT